MEIYEIIKYGGLIALCLSISSFVLSKFGKQSGHYTKTILQEHTTYEVEQERQRQLQYENYEDGAEEYEKWNKKKTRARLACDILVLISIVGCVVLLLQSEYNIDISDEFRRIFPRESVAIDKALQIHARLLKVLQQISFDDFFPRKLHFHGNHYYAMEEL